MDTFQATRVIRQCTHRISAPASRIFPLLCPVREYDWIDGWNCRMVYSESGIAENNCVFRTSFPRGAEEIWTVSHYDPEHFEIRFVIVNPQAYVMNFDISLLEDEDGSTETTWTNTLTGLNDDGNAFVANYSEQNYAAIMNGLFKALEHYLMTGQMLYVDSTRIRHQAWHKSLRSSRKTDD